jgi:hypothetical protein
MVSPRDIENLRTWIADGAFDPRVTEPRPPPTGDRPDLVTANRWSMQAVKTVEVPVVANNSWVRNDVDRFILAKLSE